MAKFDIEEENAYLAPFMESIRQFPTVDGSDLKFNPPTFKFRKQRVDAVFKLEGI